MHFCCIVNHLIAVVQYVAIHLAFVLANQRASTDNSVFLIYSLCLHIL